MWFCLLRLRDNFLIVQAFKIRLSRSRTKARVGVGSTETDAMAYAAHTNTNKVGMRQNGIGLPRQDQVSNAQDLRALQEMLPTSGGIENSTP